MERPIETRTLGEAFATAYRLTAPCDGMIRIQFVSDEDGEAYEMARVVMPEAAFLDLLQAIHARRAQPADTQGSPRQ